MKLRQILHQRDGLLRQVRLANAAFAYDRLSGLVERIARARLRGTVVLAPADPASERFVPEFTGVDCPQSVVDEHFLDEDVADLADILGFLGIESSDGEWCLRLEELGPRYLPGLQRELESAGVELPPAAPLDAAEAGEAFGQGEPGNGRDVQAS